MDEATYLIRVGQLENWGAYARQRIRDGKGRCGSVEGRYIAPKDPEGTKLLGLALPSLDLQDAALMERAVCLVPRHTHRWLIVHRYAMRWRAEKLGRLLQQGRRLSHRELLLLVEAKLFEATAAVDHAYQADEAHGRSGSVPPLVLARLRTYLLQLRATTDPEA